MKNTIAFAIIASIIAFAAQAQAVCTQYPNGQIICAPAGGGASSYR